MKKIVIFWFLLLTVIGLRAQVNPYEDLGIETKVLTLSNGKYEEFFDLDSIQQIGTILYNINTGEVVGEVEGNEKYYTPKFAPSRFISPDPIAEDFPWIDPYAYALNNPLRFVDPDGRMAVDALGVDGVETDYKNKRTGEVVRVNDGIDRTIEVNDTDFAKAQDFASRSEIADWTAFEGGWSQSDQQEYHDFYQSVNSYDKFSLSSAWDYLMGGPDDGRIEISPGGPTGKAGGTVLSSLRVPKGKVFWDALKGKVVKGGQFMRKKLDNYFELFKKGQKPQGTPRTTNTTTPSEIDRSMEEFLKNTGRFFKDHMNGDPPGGG